jgi:hypothetical protein
MGMAAIPKEIGSSGYCARIIRSTMADSVTLMAGALTAHHEDRPGTAFGNLKALVSADPNSEILAEICDVSLDSLERLVRMCGDLATSIAVLMESEEPTAVSPMVLERVLGEAVLRICYIFDVEIPPARMLVRMAAYQLEAVEDQLHTTEAFGKDGIEDVEANIAQIQKMHALLAKAGFERTSARRSVFTASLSLYGQRDNLDMNATDAYKKYIKVGQWQWATGSGAIHSRGWFLPNVFGTRAEPAMSSRDDIAATVALSVLELSDSFARAALGFTGVNINGVLRRNHQRRLGLAEPDIDQDKRAVHFTEYGAKPEPRRVDGNFSGASFYRA